MTTTLYLTHYSPRSVDSNAPGWLDEVTIADDGTCSARYADGQTEGYASIAQLLGAHAFDSRNLQEWLIKHGRSHEAGQLAMAVAVTVCASKSTRVSRLTHDAAVYERLDLFSGDWDREALIELAEDGRLRVIALDRRIAEDLGAVWLDARSGEGVARLLARGLLGGQ